MNILLSKITFKSNIKFCTPAEFENNKPSNYKLEYPDNYDEFFKFQETYKEMHPNEASWPWNIQSIRNEVDLITGKIFTCSAGGITKNKDQSIATRYHLVPEEANITAISTDTSTIST